MRRLISLLALVAIIACSSPGSFFVTVVFPDEASKEQTRNVRVVAMEAGQGCQGLLEGAAAPGDEGYAVEDEVTVAYPSGEGARALETEGAGARIFFAQALDELDQPILHGCAEAEGGGSGPREVIITLRWIGAPCETDGECDDHVFCNGEESCVEGRCEREARDCDDADPCTDDECIEGLDRCDHTPVAEPPGQEGPRGDPSCDDGLDNDCDGMTDGVDTGCITCGVDAECNDGNACTQDSCESGACLNAPVDDGQGCDDGLFCTDQDACTGGICRGSERDCSTVEDDCNTAGCDELGDSCVPLPVEDGTGCDDGQWCTEADACTGGVCAGAARECGSQAGGCILGVCNDVLDRCEDQPAVDGTACDDSLYCTVNDRCAGGACVPGGDRDCSATGGGCIDGVCDEVAGACVGDPLPAGTNCDDEVNCTENDTCDDAGSCAGVPMDCTAFDNQCNLGTCNEATGTCVRQSTNEGQPCDDGLHCNQGETCQLGLCEGGGPLDCDDGDSCTSDLCDEAADACDNPLNPVPGAEGLSVPGTCDDLLDNDCDGSTDLADTDCQQCQNDDDCDDANDCTVNQCVDSQCQTSLQPDGSSCDDGDFCTDPDDCTSGVCGGSPRDCTFLDDQCNLGVCNEAQDQCQAQPINEGGGCDDGLFCTTGEICQSGACGGGSTTDCTGLDDDCNTGVCNEGGGTCEAQPVNEGGPCEDGLFCTTNESCMSGTCIAGGPTDCDWIAGECEFGFCNEGIDACEALNQPSGTQCSDGYECTQGEECDGTGSCLLGAFDDGYCDAMFPGQVCRPDCFQNASGCGMPPPGLGLACTPDPVDLGTTDTTSCDIQLGLSGHGPCLSCSHRQPIRTLDFLDFTNCDLRGWNLLGDVSCFDNIDNCSENGQIPCCDDLGGICSYYGPTNEWYMRCDQATNGCGLNDAEWRLVKTYDLSGLGDIELCFESADEGANSNEGILVYACDASHGCEQIFCHMGPVIPGSNWVPQRFCALLPTWTVDNPSVSIEIAAHSSAPGDVVSIDDLSVRAWSRVCTPSYVLVFSEDFNGCPDPLQNGWNGWSVQGNNVECWSQSWSCTDQTDHIVLDNEAAVLERFVDASSLDEDVLLCFEYATDNPSPSDALTVEIDTGSGWRLAWRRAGEAGGDRDCAEFCVCLSDQDPAAINNPSLGIRFVLEAFGGRLSLDNIRLTGAVHCAGGPELQLSAVTDNGDGTYTFTAQDVIGSPMYPDILCTWGDPAQGVTGVDPVLFR